MEKSEIINSWSPQEQWVWNQIKIGRTADFNERYDEQLDPKLRKGWSVRKKNRTISQKFIEDILLHGDLKTEVRNRGVRIIGALFTDPLNLENIRLDHLFWLDDCRFQANANFEGLNVSEWFSLEGSYFNRNLNLQGATMRGANLMISVKEKANLNVIKIHGDAEMDEALFCGSFSMNSTEIKGSLSMTKGVFRGSASMANIRVEGQIDLTGCEFYKILHMYGIGVSNHLFLRSISAFGEIDLSASIIKGQLDLSQSSLKGNIDMHSIEIGQNLFLHKIARSEEIILNAAKVFGKIEIIDLKSSAALQMNDMVISSDITITQGSFSGIDMSFSKIGGEITFKSSKLSQILDMRYVEIGKGLDFSGNGSYNGVLLSNSMIHGDVTIDGIIFEKNKNKGPDLVSGHNSKEEEEEEPLEYALDISSSQIMGELFMHNCIFNGEVNISYSEIFKDVLIGEKVRFENLECSHANIGGSVNIYECLITRNVDFYSVTVGQDFNFSNNECLGIFTLTNGKIGNDFNLFSSHMAGGQDELEEQGGLEYFGSQPTWSSVNMNSCKIEGGLSIQEVLLDHPLQAHASEIQKNVKIEITEEIPSLDFSFSLIGENLQCINEQSLTELNLEEVKVGGNLLLFFSNYRHLNLVGAEVLGLFELNPWGNHWEIEMQGFTFKTANFSSEKNTSTKDRKNNNLQWLSLDPDYHPQPYQELAMYNTQVGNPGIADSIKYKSKERRRAQAWNHGQYGSWIGLTLSKLFIGYGLGNGYFWALVWFMALSLAGWAVIVVTNASSSIPEQSLFWASFDNALPLIELNHAHQKILFDQPNKLVVSFFYMQKLFGYLLGGFIVSGLSGLTQKGGQ